MNDPSFGAALIEHSTYRPRRLMRWTFAPQLLLLGMIAACGGGGEDSASVPPGAGATVPSPAPSGVYRCTMPAEGPMAVPPETVMGGQIEGRSDGSFVMVSHRLWGVPHVVLMLGPDMPGQGLIGGYIDVVPGQLFCPSDGGQFSNGAWFSNDGLSSGGYVYLKLEIDPAQGLLSGTLRDYGADGAVQSVKGGPIVGTLFDPAEPSSIAAAVGDWTLNDAAGQPAGLSLAPDGSLQLKMAQCSYSGSLVPVKGLNLMDMNLRAQPGCNMDTDETQGFVVLLPLADGGQQLMLWGVDNGWGFVAHAIGRR
jgi:hypothetical protein